MTRTDINNPAPHFTATDRRVVIGRSGHSGRWTYVYTPSDDAKRWDGAHSRTTHCTGSQHGYYPFVEIKVTGRKDRYDVPGIDGAARKIRITFCIGTEDEKVVDGWIVGGGDSV